jgi:uncharacterized HAD superfamily protein
MFKRIAVDFDDVIIPFMSKFMEYCSSRLNQKISIDRATRPTFREILNCPELEARELFEDYIVSPEWIELHQIPPFDNCQEKLTEFKEKGHSLVLVTAREERFREITQKYIETY